MNQKQNDIDLPLLNFLAVGEIISNLIEYLEAIIQIMKKQ